MIEICNGKIIEAGESIYPSKNRAFSYGDGLFETIRIYNGRALFVQDHFERLLYGMNYLRFDFNIAVFTDEIKTAIETIVESNNIINGRLRLVVFRNAEGKYKPSGDEISWHLLSESLATADYVTNEKGLSITLYQDDLKSMSALSGIKSLNCLIYILAAKHAQFMSCDDALLLNTNRELVESTVSNIFIRKDKLIITPPLSSGCLNGVMRKNVLRILHQKNMVIEERTLMPDELFESDEIILTNVISGARWVASYKGKLYLNQTTTLINEWLNLEITGNH